MILSTGQKLVLRRHQAVAVGVTTAFTDYVAGLATSGGSSFALNSVGDTDIVAAPGSGVGRLVEQVSVNNDTDDPIVIEVFNDIGGVKSSETGRVCIAGRCSFEYSSENGWTHLNSLAREMASDLDNSLLVPLVLTPHWTSANVTTQKTLTSGTIHGEYMGRAAQDLTSVQFLFNVTTILGGTITWAEVALAKGKPLGVSPFQPTLTVVGFADAVATFGATGIKNVTINVDPSQTVGYQDDLWFLIGRQSTGGFAVRGGSQGDDIFADRTIAHVGRPSLLLGTPTQMTTTNGTPILASMFQP